MIDGMAVTAPDPPKGTLHRFLDSDLWHSFTRSWLTMIAAAVTLVFFSARCSRRGSRRTIHSIPRRSA